MFVLGGVVIPESLWHEARDHINSVKAAKNIEGEIKWKWVFNKRDENNSLNHLSIETRLDEVVRPILEFIRSHKSDLRIFSTLTYVNELKVEFIAKEKIEENSPNFKSKFEYFCYHKNYENIVQRFQYHLQDCKKTGEDSKGIIICDGRNSREDEAIRNLHQEMLKGSPGKAKINYQNLIEHVLVAPSHYSIGIQYADIVAGIIFSRLRFNFKTDYLFEIIQDCFAKRNDGGNLVAEGRGVVKIPKESQYWKDRYQKDREMNFGRYKGNSNPKNM